MELTLVFPTLELKEKALDYREEHFKNGENSIHGDDGLDEAESYEEWIEKINEDLSRDDGKRVPSTTYFGVTDGKIVGTIQIRHKLNEYLLATGGNIGYGVRPSERRKGYASRMLRLALAECRRLGIYKVLVSCNKTNIGSAKTILKCGGVLENEVVSVRTGNIVQRYWITLPQIRQITEEELPQALEVIHKSFATVATAFNITKENCPRHTSFMPIENLRNYMKWGWLMFGLFDNNRLCGYFSLSKEGEETYELHNLSVLPEYRNRGYGKMLLDYAKEKSKELGSSKLTLNIIDENSVLKNWYTANGFVYTGSKKFSHLPFTSGYMECVII